MTLPGNPNLIKKPTGLSALGPVGIEMGLLIKEKHKYNKKYHSETRPNTKNACVSDPHKPILAGSA